MALGLLEKFELEFCMLHDRFLSWSFPKKIARKVVRNFLLIVE